MLSHYYAHIRRAGPPSVVSPAATVTWWNACTYGGVGPRHFDFFFFFFFYFFFFLERTRCDVINKPPAADAFRARHDSCCKHLTPVRGSYQLPVLMAGLECALLNAPYNKCIHVERRNGG